MAQSTNNTVSNNWKKLGQEMDFSAYMPTKPKPSTYKPSTNPTSFTGAAAFNAKKNHNTWSNKQGILNPNFRNPLTVTGSTNPNGTISNPDRSKLTIGSLGDAMKQNYALPGPVSPVFKGDAQNQSPLGGSAPMGSGGGVAAQVTNGAISNRDQQINSIASQAQNIQSGIDNLRNQQNATATTPARTLKTSKDTTFRGILDSLLGASDPTREQERTRQEMERIAAGNKSIMDNARATSEKYGQEIARVGQLGAGAVAGNLSTGTNVVGSGNAAIASQSASQRMQALGQGLEAELKGSAQQLTGQEQMAQAMRPSLEAALTQQQQQLSGLGNAAGLAAPMNIPYSAGGFDPLTGQQIAGGLGGYAGYNAAQQAFDLTGQYPDAGVQFDPNLSPQENLQRIQQAISGGSPTYQRGTFGAAGADSFMGAQQLGAAGTITGQVAQLQAKGEAAKANFQNLLGIMQRGQVNNLDQPILNQLQNSVRRGLTSDADVVAFEAMRNSLVAAYADVLSGGNPTNEYLNIAESKLPKDVSLKTMTSLEKEISSYYQNLVAGMNQAISQYSNQGGTGGGGGWDW
jgi:hypothetical protein